MLVLTATALVLVVTSASGAGVGVHDEIGKRAMEMYYNKDDSLQLGYGAIQTILRNNQDAFQVRKK